MAHSPYVTVFLFTSIDAPVYYFLPGKLSFSHGDMPRTCISGAAKGVSGHRVECVGRAVTNPETVQDAPFYQLLQDVLHQLNVGVEP